MRTSGALLLKLKREIGDIIPTAELYTTGSASLLSPEYGAVPKEPPTGALSLRYLPNRA